MYNNIFEIYKAYLQIFKYEKKKVPGNILKSYYRPLCFEFFSYFTILPCKFEVQTITKFIFPNY